MTPPGGTATLKGTKVSLRSLLNFYKMNKKKSVYKRVYKMDEQKKICL